MDRLVEEIEVLEEDDRAFFLKAASGADKDMERFLNAVDDQKSSDLGMFLTAAAKSGKGLSSLLDLHTTAGRTFLKGAIQFGIRLEDDDAEAFFQATGGLLNRTTLLMDTASHLSGQARNDYLTIAVSAGSQTLTRLSQMVSRIDLAQGRPADFLSTALNSGVRLNPFLGVAESIGEDDRNQFFSITAGLNAVDLAGFIQAASVEPSQAYGLATAADELTGQNKSYFLYAATINPSHISDLINVTRELKENDQDNFLYVSANIAGDDKTASMAQLIDASNRLSGGRRSDFLKLEKTIATGGAGDSLYHDYIYLKSFYSENEMRVLLATGEHTDTMAAAVSKMDESLRRQFFSAANKINPSGLPGLFSVMGRLDEERQENFLSFSAGLRPSLLIDSAQGTLNLGLYFTMDDFLASAAWLSLRQKDTGEMLNWCRSFTRLKPA